MLYSRIDKQELSLSFLEKLKAVGSSVNDRITTQENEQAPIVVKMELWKA